MGGWINQNISETLAGAHLYPTSTWSEDCLGAHLTPWPWKPLECVGGAWQIDLIVLSSVVFLAVSCL